MRPDPLDLDASLQRGQADIAAGRTRRFVTVEALIADLHDSVDLDALRQDVDQACEQLEHDNRSYLRPVLQRIIDAIAALQEWAEAKP